MPLVKGKTKKQIFIQLQQAFQFAGFRFFWGNLAILENRKCFQAIFKNAQVLPPGKTSNLIKIRFFSLFKSHLSHQLS
jgi:hypothetical protein